jgi:hypothetical protein
MTYWPRRGPSTRNGRSCLALGRPNRGSVSTRCRLVATGSLGKALTVFALKHNGQLIRCQSTDDGKNWARRDPASEWIMSIGVIGPRDAGWQQHVPVRLWNRQPDLVRKSSGGGKTWQGSSAAPFGTFRKVPLWGRRPRASPSIWSRSGWISRCTTYNREMAARRGEGQKRSPKGRSHRRPRSPFHATAGAYMFRAGRFPGGPTGTSETRAGSRTGCRQGSGVGLLWIGRLNRSRGP